MMVRQTCICSFDVSHRPYRAAQDRLLWKRRDLSCMYPAHHELESVYTVIYIWWPCSLGRHAVAAVILAMMDAMAIIVRQT